MCRRPSATDSRVGSATEIDAVLCRGNADAMQEVLGFLERGVPVALMGGGGALSVRLVDTYGPDVIIDAVDRLVL